MRKLPNLHFLLGTETGFGALTCSTDLPIDIEQPNRSPHSPRAAGPNGLCPQLVPVGHFRTCPNPLPRSSAQPLPRCGSVRAALRMTSLPAERLLARSRSSLSIRFRMASLIIQPRERSRRSASRSIHSKSSSRIQSFVCVAFSFDALLESSILAPSAEALPRKSRDLLRGTTMVPFEQNRENPGFNRSRLP